jgi:hypothetical protein
MAGNKNRKIVDSIPETVTVKSGRGRKPMTEAEKIAAKAKREETAALAAKAQANGIFVSDEEVMALLKPKGEPGKRGRKPMTEEEKAAAAFERAKIKLLAAKAAGVSI